SNSLTCKKALIFSAATRFVFDLTNGNCMFCTAGDRLVTNTELSWAKNVTSDHKRKTKNDLRIPKDNFIRKKNAPFPESILIQTKLSRHQLSIVNYQLSIN